MENRIFTDHEDRAFTDLVLSFNELEEKENPSLYADMENRIRERTSVLLYLIPMRNLFLREENAGEFFLDIQKDIAAIIRSFRISGLTYNGYLTQICRYRVMRYQRRKDREKSFERAMLLSDITIHEPQLKERIIAYSARHANVKNMNLSEISYYIIRNQGTAILALNKAEADVSRYLKHPMKRRQFVSFLLSLPQVETPGFIAGVSRLLRIDIETASRFYSLRHEALQKENGRLMESRELVAGRHWELMVKLRRAIIMEIDDEKKSELKQKYEKLQAAYERRRKLISRNRTGLSHSAISRVLGISRSCVTYNIRKTREALEELTGKRL